MMEKLQVNDKRYEKKIPGGLDLRKVKVWIYKTGRPLFTDSSSHSPPRSGLVLQSQINRIEKKCCGW